MSKISIIGAGSIGATTAFALLQKGVATEIILNDINQEKALGEVLDLIHGSSLCKPCKISLGTLEDTANSDIIIITAGLAQKPGETRLDLVDKNYNIFKNFIPTLANLSPNSILLVVSNPVDILAYMTYKLSGFPKNRVIGSGTVLDTARLRSLLGKYFEIDGRNVEGYVLGEHGDSEFVAWSELSIGNIPVKSFSEQFNIEWDKETENVIENAQNKFFKKNCDLLVVNDLFEDGAGFKTDTNKVALITKNFVDYLDLMSKEDLAHIILEKLMKVKGE